MAKRPIPVSIVAAYYRDEKTRKIAVISRVCCFCNSAKKVSRRARDNKLYCQACYDKITREERIERQYALIKNNILSMLREERSLR